MAEPALASETLTSQARAPLRVVGPAATSTTTQAQPPTTRLEVPPYELQAALALERELGIGHVLAQVLVRRGLSEAAAARAFLDAAEHHPPAAFTAVVWSPMPGRWKGGSPPGGVSASAVPVRDQKAPMS